MDLLASPNLSSCVVAVSMDRNDRPFSRTARLCLYDMTQSQVTLTAQHGSDQHQIIISTKWVEPFEAQVGSLYVVLGDLEHQKGKPGPHTCFFPLGPGLGSLLGASVRTGPCC